MILDKPVQGLRTQVLLSVIFISLDLHAWVVDDAVTSGTEVLRQHAVVDLEPRVSEFFLVRPLSPITRDEDTAGSCLPRSSSLRAGDWDGMAHPSLWLWGIWVPSGKQHQGES